MNNDICYYFTLYFDKQHIVLNTIERVHAVLDRRVDNDTAFSVHSGLVIVNMCQTSVIVTAILILVSKSY